MAPHAVDENRIVIAAAATSSWLDSTALTGLLPHAAGQFARHRVRVDLLVAVAVDCACMLANANICWGQLSRIHHA
jgi:hypothetical protein